MLKWLVYLLLLLNIGLFAWHYRGMSSPDSVSVQSLPAGVSRLVLLREQQQENDQASQWCYSLGPFESASRAEALNRQLHDWQVDSWLRKSQEARRKGYWVLLPPLPSRQQARDVVARLKAKGIEDYFLVATGEQANGISLGVFSKFESAHRRINQMNKLGFEPVLEEVKLPAEEYWLDWRRETGESLGEEQLQQLRQKQTGLQQIERACNPPEQSPIE